MTLVRSGVDAGGEDKVRVCDFVAVVQNDVVIC